VAIAESPVATIMMSTPMNDGLLAGVGIITTSPFKSRN
jgi:hypothetical protein